MFGKNGCMVINAGGKVIATATKRKNLYQLNNVETPNHAHVANQRPTIELWHRRLGHISVDRIKRLADGLANGIELEKDLKLELCRACVEGKQHRSSLPTEGGTRAKDLL